MIPIHDINTYLALYKYNNLTLFVDKSLIIRKNNNIY